MCIGVVMGTALPYSIVIKPSFVPPEIACPSPLLKLAAGEDENFTGVVMLFPIVGEQIVLKMISTRLSASGIVEKGGE